MGSESWDTSYVAYYLQKHPTQFSPNIMTRFRTNLKKTTKTENLAGGEAFKESDKLELVSLLLTSFVKDKFYESAGKQLARLEDLVNKIKDKKFIAKAAIYARKEFGMRSITHALLAELSKIVKGEEWMKHAVQKATHRPDDMMEILGYYLSKYKRPIPNALKKGITLAMKNFDSYQLGKYRGTRSGFKLVDLFNLVHPKPTAETTELYKKVVEDELRSENTWEKNISETGQKVKEITDETEREEKKKELKAEAWKDLIVTKKLGYFALLRNLRNILDQADDETVELAAKALVDEKQIRQSLVLPFRFSTALKEIEKTANTKTRLIVDALHDALELSLSNVPKFDGKTLVVLDESGSMNGKPMEIGSLFAAVLYKTNDADLLTFSEHARYRNLHSKDSVLSIAEKLRSDCVEGGTNFHSIFTTANQAYNRIIILSDMQGWIGYNTPSKTFATYKAKTKSNPHVYSFDLNGYGTLQFPEYQVYSVAGFSDKIFDIFKTLEINKRALINEIDKIKL